MALRWGADDDTLSRGMDAGGKEIAAEGAKTSHEDFKKWQRAQGRSAMRRARAAKSAAVGQQKTLLHEQGAKSAGQLAQAFTLGLGAAGAKTQHGTVADQQAAVGAKQAKVAGKIQQEGLYQDPTGGAPTGKMERLQARKVRLAGRQQKLGDVRAKMEENNPYLTTKYY